MYEQGNVQTTEVVVCIGLPRCERMFVCSSMCDLIFWQILLHEKGGVCLYLMELCEHPTGLNDCLAGLRMKVGRRPEVRLGFFEVEG